LHDGVYVVAARGGEMADNLFSIASGSGVSIYRTSFISGASLGERSRYRSCSVRGRRRIRFGNVFSNPEWHKPVPPKNVDLFSDYTTGFLWIALMATFGAMWLLAAHRQLTEKPVRAPIFGTKRHE
jgi:hypothetical protein